MGIAISSFIGLLILTELVIGLRQLITLTSDPIFGGDSGHCLELAIFTGIMNPPNFTLN
ncbi:hypothetical protein [Synechococcus sp. PCC 6312]|uniref:hypothetical protein n=1 Tax=Synechococcus sp. (strain ATCC 27167 / PCC 6312) TaxID=195253 RepID=UPI00029EC77E|nr:hypothetical protein [Synechococcus sp. PCC 6312]AFY60959.1 hypothetical protein Syn6312_1814 [Synechococcus sp. PCC 6312]